MKQELIPAIVMCVMGAVLLFGMVEYPVGEECG